MDSNEHACFHYPLQEESYQVSVFDKQLSNRAYSIVILNIGGTWAVMPAFAEGMHWCITEKNYNGLEVCLTCKLKTMQHSPEAVQSEFAEHGNWLFTVNE